jgi:hypothetical protein
MCNGQPCPAELTWDELRECPPGTALWFTNWPGTPAVPVTRAEDTRENGNGAVIMPDGRILCAMADELTREWRPGLECHAGR